MAARADTAAELPVVVTSYPNLYQPAQWIATRETWGSFVQRTLQAGHRQDLRKESTPLLALYSLREGGKRANEDVQLVYGICLDFDGQPLPVCAAALAKLQQAGVAVLWHSTWSHGGQKDGTECYQGRRLIFPLAQPLAPGSFDQVLDWVLARFGDGADRASKGLARAFFAPSCHPQHAIAARPELLYFPGGGLDVSDIGEAPVQPTRPQLRLIQGGKAAAAELPPAVRVIDTQVWQQLIRRWTASRSATLVDVGNRMRRVLDGLSFAEPGERDTVLWDILRTIARSYPDADTSAICELFRRSIEAMSIVPEAPTMHDVREKFERARAYALALSDTNLPADRRAAIRQAFGFDRESPYSDEEIEEIRGRLNVSHQELERLWILHSEAEYYLLGHRARFHHVGEKGFLNSARVVLSPAPVTLHTLDKDVRRMLRRDELLERYSTPLAGVAKSLIVQQPVLDLSERTLLLPVCPMRRITPAFNADIDTWLRSLCGPEQYPRMVQWLSLFPRLERPLVGLVLTGAKSTGKSMLANGLARLWSTTGPSKLTEAMDRFNTTLERCPFCHGDESDLPKDARGFERTDALREFIQARTRLVNEKYRVPVPLEGSTRLQISANNTNIFGLRGHLTDNDIFAIADRFLHIQVDPLAALFLAERGGQDFVTPWVEGDGLAAHVLWLSNQAPAWEGRFGVASDPELANTLAVRQAERAAVAELIVRSLKEDHLSEGLRVVNGHVCCTVEWVLRSWNRCHQDQRRPPTTVLAGALRGLGQQITTGDGIWTVVETQRLTAWALEAGLVPVATVERWIAKHGG